MYPALRMGVCYARAVTEGNVPIRALTKGPKFHLMVKRAAAFYDAFKDTAGQLVDRRESANRHCKIYRAIRDGKPEDASKATLDDIRREYAVYKAQFSSANSCVEER